MHVLKRAPFTLLWETLKLTTDLYIWGSRVAQSLPLPVVSFLSSLIHHC
jgi:hypothetical protein